MIAIELEDVLRALGCTVIGPVAKLVDAIELARTESLDAAILDVTIRGGQVFPVAEILLERDIPFVFASGYGDWALPENMRDRPRLTKPFTTVELEEQIKLLCAQAMKRKMR
ncbi:response regulator [Rhizobium sp. BJ04]|uniref:response regulator n=1 Tax=Rhizobium binxianense TaxID=3024242 RepID=UPI0023A93A68|nr:response regulator [Rhizobium sp. BJ04]WEA60840.1 response regulator [Rhizobium sp. BJ04]